MEPSGLIVIVAPLVFPIAITLGVIPFTLALSAVVNMVGMIHATCGA
jgi:C4-dicarboxylate transporter DctM subunit